jgi:hypothetical protein
VTITCFHCGQPIGRDDLDRCWRKVSGWEKHREQGGTNALALREVEDLWMHNSCMLLAKRGIAPGQGTLV